MRKLCVTVCCFLSVCGCEEYVATDSPALSAVQRDYVLAFVLDTSGSFVPRMFDGKELGYKFFIKASDQYFRNRMGDHDRILISQLSANYRTLLWEGAPLALRRRFGNSESLRKFIQENSDPAGSRVYASVADTLDYIQALPGVSDGKTKVCVLVLSDMLDTSMQPEDRQRMMDSLERFAKTNGSIGLYWVDQFSLSDCRQCLATSGIRDYVVESEIVDDPSLPFANP
jgi:hypothetical protein